MKFRTSTILLNLGTATALGAGAFGAGVSLLPYFGIGQ